jgi:DNA polymerase I-like protein with 3'-5' exonuclease and polymerase domains
MPRLRLLPPPEVAETPEQAAPILNHLMNRGGLISIDTETTGLDVMRDRVLFWSMATESRRWCFPVDLLLFFDPLFQRRDVSWALANAKYDMHLLCNMGTGLMGPCWDIVPMDAMEDDTRSHGLKDQAEHSYGADWGDFKDLFLDAEYLSDLLDFDRDTYRWFKSLGVGDKLLRVHAERPDIVEDYASCDAYFTHLRCMDLRKALDAEELATNMVPGMSTLLDYYETIELPFTKTLWRMERAGIDIDVRQAKKVSGPLKDGIRAAENRIHKTAGTKFNITSTEELREILFADRWFGLKPISYTAGGKTDPKPSTDEKSLKILRDRVNNGSQEQLFLDSLLSYRKLVKLHGTYVADLIKPVRPLGAPALDTYSKRIGPDGRIHCRFNQAGARTSRLSSSGPNLQNIPIRGEFGSMLRAIFTAPPDDALIVLDYPQIEFRVAAVLAEEEKMLEAIRKGWDIHSSNANDMYADADYDKILEARHKKDTDKTSLTVEDKQQLKYRDGAKTAGLGTMYGEGPKKMAGQLGISVDAASELIETFFTTFRKLGAYIEETKDYAHHFEYTYTMLGRKRRLHRINNTVAGGIAAAEERQAFNTVIQGSSAEMLKLAMLQLDAHEEFQELGGVLRLTVHDELVSSSDKQHAERCYEIKKSVMADPYRWGPIQLAYPVPVDPDGSIGFRWSEAK